MRKYAILLLPLLLIIGATLFFVNKNKITNIISPVGEDSAITKEKPLEKYTFKNLQKQKFGGSRIELDKVIDDEKLFTSHLFSLTTDNKKVSGVANVPKRDGKLPVVVMLRGFAEKENYTPGTGTKNSSRAFARNGFITLAPDFLGYGESASPSADVFEERLQKYTTTLDLLASISSLPQADPDRVGIWGHSNGGQIALSVLEITGRAYPTVLWAPVSKPFPYSILYYTDEYDDRGKLLRKALARFEKDYDVEKYDPTLFYKWINSEILIQLHQGGADDAVPREWSDTLYNQLTELKLEVDYYTYPAEDHNFTQGSWQTVINRNVIFFKNNL